MKNNKRIPLENGTYLFRTIGAKNAEEYTNYPENDDFYEADSGIKITIKQKIDGEGSTCLVYKGAVILSGEEIRQVIIKEFYPFSAKPYSDISKRESGRLRALRHQRCPLRRCA